MEIHQQILEKLKCGECGGYLSAAPIFTTEDGRSYCGRCPKPECVSVRNVLYEELIQMMSFPCQFENEGCRKKIPYANLQSHEAECEFRPYICPVMPSGNCEWMGPLIMLWLHCNTKHANQILKHPCVLRHDIKKNSLNTFVTWVFDSVFLIHAKVCLLTRKIYHSVRLVGDKEKAALFKYDIHIEGNGSKIAKTGQVAPLGCMMIQEDSSVVSGINGLLEILGGFEDTTFTISIQSLHPPARNNLTKIVRFVAASAGETRIVGAFNDSKAAAASESSHCRSVEAPTAVEAPLCKSAFYENLPNKPEVKSAMMEPPGTEFSLGDFSQTTAPLKDPSGVELPTTGLLEATVSTSGISASEFPTVAPPATVYPSAWLPGAKTATGGSSGVDYLTGGPPGADYLTGGPPGVEYSTTGVSATVGPSGKRIPSAGSSGAGAKAPEDEFEVVDTPPQSGQSNEGFSWLSAAKVITQTLTESLLAQNAGPSEKMHVCFKCCKLVPKVGYRTNDRVFCPGCAPQKRHCKNRHLGCRFFDVKQRVKAHETGLCNFSNWCWFCARNIKGYPMSNNHFKLAHSEDMHRAGQVFRVSEDGNETIDFIVTDNKIGEIFGTGVLNNNKFEVELTSVLESDRICKYRCILTIINPVNKRVIMQKPLEQRYNDEMDWFYKITGNQYNKFVVRKMVDIKVNIEGPYE